MARAKPELRPCRIGSGPVAAGRHPNPWEFVPDLRSTRLENSCANSTDSAMTALVVTHRSGPGCNANANSALLERFRILKSTPVLRKNSILIHKMQERIDLKFNGSCCIDHT